MELNECLNDYSLQDLILLHKHQRKQFQKVYVRDVNTGESIPHKDNEEADKAFEQYDKILSRLAEMSQNGVFEQLIKIMHTPWRQPTFGEIADLIIKKRIQELLKTKT